MSLQFFGHPFSSYTQKVLIALYADATPFDYRNVDPAFPENGKVLKRISPFGLFPTLVDDGEVVLESTPIIEHLQARHPGPNQWIPDGDEGRRARFLDRFFDLHVMGNMQTSVADTLRPDGAKDPYGVAKSLERLNTAYDWLDANLGDGPWAVGDRFTLADCAAAPSLFYADWVEEMGDTRPRLKAYRSRLLAHPAVSRCVEEARPYRAYFPLGAPDRD